MPYSAERACFGTSASSLTRGWVTGLQALLAYLLTNSAGGELALVSKEGTLGCSLCFSDFAMVGVIFSWKWLRVTSRISPMWMQDFPGSIWQCQQVISAQSVTYY